MNATNCAQVREQMLDVLTDSLSDNIRSAFDAHLGVCAVCAKEFRHVQTVVQAIDRTLSANLAAEPSPKLVANVRERIRQSTNVQPHRAGAWTRWSAWATAAGVCAAVALLLVVARTSRKFHRTVRNSVAAQTDSSSSKPVANAHPNTAIEAGTTVQLHKSRIAAVRRASRRTLRENDDSEPEIIVQPGQTQAILRFAAAMQRGQIDGAQFLAGQKAISEPLEIKPLVIAPLKISASENELEPSTSNDGFDSSKSSLSNRSN